MTIRQIYIYLVCVITLTTGIFHFGWGVWSGIRILFPQITLAPHEWNRISSFERFKNSWEVSRKQGQTGEQLKERWENEKAFVLDNERRYGIQQLLWAMMWLFIVIPIFLFHWVVARRMYLKGQ